MTELSRADLAELYLDVELARVRGYVMLARDEGREAEVRLKVRIRADGTIRAKVRCVMLDEREPKS